jgi:SAM-dependent methyltransferase
VETAVEPITFWERVAQTRWGKYITEIEQEAILKAHRLAGTPSVAVEVGCEGGRWSKLLSEIGWQMICTDVDAKSLEVCKSKVPTAITLLVQPDDTRIPCDPETAGLMLCIEVWEVMQSGWFPDEIFRVLKPDGLIMGAFTNRLSLRGTYRHFSARRRHKYDFYQHSYPLWRQHMRSKGFSFLFERGMCWFPFPRESNSPLVPVCTRIERSLGLQRIASLSPWVAFIAQKRR